MIKNRFSLSLGAIALGLTLALAGCTGGEKTASTSAGTSGTDTPTASGDTIKIGIVAPVTGDNKPWGDDSLAGAKMAVAEFNAAGGVNGKQVELLQGDSASRPEPAKSAAEKLLSDGVIAIVGEVSSGNTMQIADAASSKGVPVVAVGATRTDLTDGKDNVFRVCYTDDFQGPVMAKFAYDKLGKRKVAILTDVKLPYSQGLSASFKKEFMALGGQVVAEESYEQGQSQFSGQLTAIKAKNPDVIFCSGYFTEVGPIAQQARAAGIAKSVPMLGGDGWDSDQILTSGGDAILGSYFCNHYNNKDNRPQVTTFLDKWHKEFNGKDPGTTMAALGYDATALTLDALKRASEPTATALAKAIDETENYAGVSGDITLKGMHGNPAKRAIIVEVTPKDDKGNWQKYATDYTPDQLK